MVKSRIYLAGPITGQSYDQATAWREQVVNALPDVRCFSPMRGKECLKGLTKIKALEDGIAGIEVTPSFIMTRDYNDCTQADLLLVNFSEPTGLSVGTAMEIAWAFHLRIPVIVICSTPETEAHLRHPMIQQAVNLIVPTVEDAIRLTRIFLFPDLT